MSLAPRTAVHTQPSAAAPPPSPSSPPAPLVTLRGGRLAARIGVQISPCAAAAPSACAPSGSGLHLGRTVHSRAEGR